MVKKDNRFDARFDDQTSQNLAELAAVTGKDQSKIVRDLINAKRSALQVIEEQAAAIDQEREEITREIGEIARQLGEAALSGRATAQLHARKARLHERSVELAEAKGQITDSLIDARYAVLDAKADHAGELFAQLVPALDVVAGEMIAHVASLQALAEQFYKMQSAVDQLSNTFHQAGRQTPAISRVISIRNLPDLVDLLINELVEANLNNRSFLAEHGIRNPITVKMTREAGDPEKLAGELAEGGE